MNCNKKTLSRFVSALVVLFAAVSMLPACTDVNDALGSNLIPDNQRMVIRIDTLHGLKTYMTQTDSVESRIVGSSYAYLGQLQNDTFGMRRCAFIGQIAHLRAEGDLQNAADVRDLQCAIHGLDEPRGRGRDHLLV